jgi:two-component system LytT family sensor kinase
LPYHEIRDGTPDGRKKGLGMTSPWRSRARTLLILTGLFFLVTLFYTTSNFFLYRLDPREYRLSLWQEFLLYAVRWLPWVVCAPAAIWLARAFPLRGRGWPARLAILVPGGLILASLESFLSVGLYKLLFRSLVDLPPAEGTYLNDFWLTGLNYLHNNLVTFLVILVVVWGLDHLRLYRERELAAGRLEAELARANLQVLKNQVHPHFLFNTLNMISAVVYQDPRLADRMIARLSDLLRATLERTDAQVVPLREELDLLTLYLDIMKARFGDRLAVVYDIAPETLPALIPSFSLQPLVENAIKHGIMPRKEGGTVTIAASRNDGRLVIGVSNDGPGLEADTQTLMVNGVGLKNIQNRLRGLYGSDCVFGFKKRTEGGVRIAFEIPFQNQAP